jgi:pimeloyl-ACP methyl ester carboxylesterase
MRARAGCAAAACVLLLAGCASARLESVPGVYDTTQRKLEFGTRSIHAKYVTQAQPAHAGYLVVFATGDGGWRGTSNEVFEHLAQRGYTIAGFSAREIIRPVERAEERVSTALAVGRLAEVYAQAKSDLDLPGSTPIIVVGFSRGATLVAFTALHPQLREGVRGAVAIALTREAGYLREPKAEREPGIQVDDRGRIQIYPALQLLGSTRLAVIQSSGDGYVPSAESRTLLGPDTARRRLYEVAARNHRFGGARDQLLLDLDDALRWIEDSARPAVPAN